MHIRQCITSLQDLEQKFGPRLKQRVERLVHAYQKVLRKSVEPLIIRAVCVAVSFADVAQCDGAMACNFDDMMHGRVSEHLEFQGRELVYSDEDTSVEEQLVWDTVCLMLEEYIPVSQMPQQAYNIAGLHAQLAYCTEVMYGASVPPAVIPVKAPPQMDEVAELRRQLAQMTEERDRYRDEVQKHRDEVQKHRDEVLTLRGRNEALENELAWHRANTQHTTDALLAKLSLPKTDNHFGADSCHFGQGSTMNGNIE